MLAYCVQTIVKCVCVIDVRAHEITIEIYMQHKMLAMLAYCVQTIVKRVCMVDVRAHEISIERQAVTHNERGKQTFDDGPACQN